MINTTRTPVALYKWDDAGAPQITYTPGSVKTILKACLFSGYGEGSSRKEPLGWDMRFEEANQAVFQSKAKENEGWSLSVVDNFRKSGGTQTESHVGCRIIQHPKSVSEGSKVGDVVRVGMSNSSFLGTGKWWLIGNEKGFILIASDSSSGQLCGVLNFSMFPTLVPADAGNWLLYFTGSAGSYGYSGYGVNMMLAANYENLNGARGSLMSKANANSPLSYPNPATGGFVADNCFVVEWLGLSSGSANFVRGLFPGNMMIYEAMPEGAIIPFGTIYSNLDDSGDRYLYYKSTSQQGMLVNIDAWEM